MSVQSAETEQSEGESPAETSGSSQFVLDVEIEGLPYVFKGTIPEAPSDFSFSVHIPNRTWRELTPRVYIPETWQTSKQETLSRFLADGQIGHVDMVDTRIYSIADFRLDYIASDTWLLPQSSPYSGAHGVGRFLIKNLLTFLDLKNWSAYLKAQANGKLAQKAICDWYQKEGFEGEANEAVTGIRTPQQPDLSQPIARILRIV